jgi:hypothetical protein
MFGGSRSQSARCRVGLRALALAMLAFSVGGPTASAGNSAATIAGSFSEGCRDFAAHSSKDISHVELHYVDGRVVKDESISSPDYAMGGGAGDEIEFATVKSGTTRERFECVQANSPPTALLEIETPPVDQTGEHCYDFFFGGLACEQSSPRTAWTSTRDIPDEGGSDSGLLDWVCGTFTDYSQCSFAFRFRGTASSDPDDDIVSWSIDFGDGSSASGNWSTDPPTAVAHGYSPFLGDCERGDFSGTCAVTLTVTDSAGQTASDTMVMAFVDQTPD